VYWRIEFRGVQILECVSKRFVPQQGSPQTNALAENRYLTQKRNDRFVVYFNRGSLLFLKHEAGR